MFCFDNDCFRYLCTLLQLPQEHKQSTHDTLSSGWEHNVVECKKLLKRIQGMIAHDVEDTVDINRTRSLLIAMARPLTEVAQNHLMNKKMVEDKIKEINLLKGKDISLSAKVERKQLTIEKIPLKFPKTVCTEKRCNDMVVGEDGQQHSVPKKPCHDDCKIPDIMEGELKNKGLKWCAVFNNDICKECGCDWTKHMHMKYEIKKSMETIINRKVQRELAQCKDSKRHAEILLKDLHNQLENIQNEYYLIKESSMEFSAYLKYNSVKQGVDPYYDYMSHLVRIEEDKLAVSGNKVIWMDLRGMLSDYKFGVQNILDEIKNQRRAPLSSNELNRKILNLGHMKLSGALIADIARIATEGSKDEE